jgi:hypothetical protein
LSQETLDQAQRAIYEKLQARLTEEGRRLPGHSLSAGQYLQNPDFEQRGLHGTAAAILVLADRTATDDDCAAQVGRMCHWVVNREAVEREALTAGRFSKAKPGIQFSESDTFRLAEIGFALAFVSPDVAYRAEAVTFIRDRLAEYALDTGGFSSGEGSAGGADAVATALVVRYQSAMNLHMRPEDRRYLRDYLKTSTDPYIGALVLYVLTCYTDEDRTFLRERYRDLSLRLRAQFALSSEANYEYTRAGKQDYVRIPWQIYLVQAAARLFSLTRFYSPAIQRKATEVLQAAASPEGLRYGASGGWLSTRTQASAYQLARELRSHNFDKPLPRAVGSVVHLVASVVTSRLLASVLWLTAGLIAVASVYSWITSPERSLRALGSNIVAAVVLAAVASWARRGA